jgi:hypothetical protein
MQKKMLGLHLSVGKEKGRWPIVNLRSQRTPFTPIER